MKYVAWEIVPGHCLPMMEDDRGELYGTNKTVMEGLGISEDAIRHIYSRHKNEFDSVSVTDCHANEFLRRDKALFGIKRVRSDMRVWNEDDMITFAFYAQSEKGLQFRKDLRKFLKENAKRHYVNKEEYDKLKSDFQTLTALVLQNIPAANETASAFGAGLRAQRGTKQLRNWSM